jgi:hypothetical protein
MRHSSFGALVLLLLAIAVAAFLLGSNKRQAWPLLGLPAEQTKQ